jgi:UDPglucose 6-dehydrogenase
MRIGFVGLGKLGLPCSEVMAEQHEVIGFDKEERTSNKITITKNINDCFDNTKIIFIAVPTPHHTEYDGSLPTSHLPVKNFIYDHVHEVLKICQEKASKDQIVVLISTVLPGTTRREFSKYLGNFKFVYNPYLIAMGTEAYDMVNPEMIIIGTQDGETSEESIFLHNFYKSIIKNDAPHMVGTWEEAESYKIFFNTTLSARLSIVNMIQDVAMRLGNMNVDKVTNALVNSGYKIKQGYYKAGMGDGGACHPRDNIALSWLAKELELGYDLFGAFAHSREKQTENMADFIANICKKQNLPCVINGKTYKPRIPYINGSPSIMLQHYLEKRGIKVYFADPLTEDDPNNELGTPCNAVCVLAHDPSVNYTNELQIQRIELYFSLKEGCTVIDPWRNYKNKKFVVITYGKS